MGKGTYKETYRDYNGNYVTYEKEIREPVSTAGCIFSLVCAISWYPFLLLQLPVWLVSIVRGVGRIRGKEKVGSGIYLLTVGILAGVMCIIFYTAIFTGNWNKLIGFLSQK